MAEIKQYAFTHKEVTEALVRDAGLTEGIWRLSVEFGICAANVNTSPTGQGLMPAAIIPIQKIGLFRVEIEDGLSVDAEKLSSGTKVKRAA